jgi:predicted nucleotidyltransferase component of viral defense system
VLDSRDLRDVVARFGVSDAQVRRDHLISHLLGALVPLSDDVVFLGGTALARTHVPDGRLSEDLDLMASGRRVDVATALEKALVRGVRREFPGLRWEPPLTAVRDTEHALLTSPEGLTVRVQLLDTPGYPPWPTEARDLVQRYVDAPPARLNVLTRAAFTAAKTTVWVDRRACRDLYDLYQLAVVGAVDTEAAALYRRFGPTGHLPGPHDFDRAPDATTWRRALSGQTRLDLSVQEAVAVVRRAWSSLVGRGACR